MAVMTINIPPVFAGGVGVVTVATASQITVVSGSVTQNYFGSGFTYSGASVIGGTVTSTNLIDSSNGGLQYGITGLSHSAATVASYVNSGNAEVLRFFLFNGNDTLNGSAGNDVLNGYQGFNVIYGNGGDDALYASGSADSLIGGSGNDLYVLTGFGAYTITENSGEGIDTVQSNVNFTLSDHFENLLLLNDSNAGNGTGNGLSNSISGNFYSNFLSGLAGDDTLLGLGGNDTLDGGDGVDVLQGGDGDDFYFISSLSDVIGELSGTDTAYALINNYALIDGLDNLVLGESVLNGAGNSVANVLTGNGLSNSMTGGGGNDTLYGLGGDDTLTGGADNDLYFVDSAGDVLVELAGGGVDTVWSQVSLMLGVQFENLQLDGFSAINGTGNALVNVLQGNDADNVLDGGAGADTMEGGAGNDTYYLDDLGDVVTDFSGVDSVITSHAFDLAGSTDIENVTFTGSGNFNATGNSRRNIITGNDGSNVLTAFNSFDRLHGGGGNDTLIGTGFEDTLDGGAGADSMSGGLGVDVYYVDDAGDVIIEGPVSSGSVLDTVYSSISYTLSQYIEAVVLLGNAQINASGTGYLTGNSAGNYLTGGASGSDELYGMGGDDTLDGGAGSDKMFGGAGNDFYFVDDFTESVHPAFLGELVGEGDDTIVTSQNMTLPVNFETLVLAGATYGTGNALANRLIGDGLNNVLDGKGGADTMQGGSGNDEYYVDDSSDVVLELAGEGQDVVLTSANFSLAGSDVEKLWLNLNDVSANLAGSGNDLANHLRGGFGNNLLQGGGGSDSLEGQAGLDTLVGGLGNDTLDGGEGLDTLIGGDDVDTADYRNSLAAITVNLDGAGRSGSDVVTGIENVNGSLFNDLISGDSGNNVLNGNTGADIIAGGAGNDTYVVDNSGDQVMESGNSGTDTVQSAVAYDLMQAWHVENLTLTGVNSISGSGNWLNNLITGNGAANVLDGNRGNDTLSGGAGSDTLLGGLGDDVLVWDAADGSVQGGTGADTLRLDGGGVTLDLTVVANTLITDVEIINLTGSGNNTLTLAWSDVLALSSTTDSLRIDGNAGDTFNGGSGWAQIADEVIGAENYHRYTQGGAMLLVDVDMTVNLSG